MVVWWDFHQMPGALDIVLPKARRYIISKHDLIAYNRVYSAEHMLWDQMTTGC